MSERQKEIHDKSFDIMGSSQRRVYDHENLPPHLDYNKIKVGTKVLDDAIISLGSHKNINR